MAVTVDPAGQHPAAGGVDVPRSAGKVARKRNDAAIRDAYVALEHVCGRSHLRVTDDEIVAFHAHA